MRLVGLLLTGFLGWGLILWRCDRPHLPAWKVRNTYRLLNLMLLSLLILSTFKAISYHDELTFLIRTCGR